MNRKPKHILAALVGGTALLAVACGRINPGRPVNPSCRHRRRRPALSPWSPSSPTRSTRRISKSGCSYSSSSDGEDG